MRRYRKEHPDRVAEAQNRYWQKRSADAKSESISDSDKE